MSTQTEIHPPVQQQKTRNTVGIIALITAIVGAVFAMIPGALIVGWILLPIAFILSIVSLFLKNQKRGQGIAALIISIIGTIIGVVVFIAAVGTAVDDAFNEETQIEAPVEGGDVEESVVDEDAAEEDSEAGGEEGTRDNPLALGTTISDSDWEVTVNSVDLNATDAVMAENPLNEEAAEGHTYIMANVTATYLGDNPDGDIPMVNVEYVSSGGNSYDSFDSMVVVPDSFDSLETLYEDASTAGNIAVEVPQDDIENGALRVSPGMFGDGVFFEVQ